MYLVQPFRGKGSRNCSKEVRVDENVENHHIRTSTRSLLYELVYFRLRDHIQAADNNPLLIFPEGTCVNNHYTVMFKKVQYKYMILYFRNVREVLHLLLIK